DRIAGWITERIDVGRKQIGPDRAAVAAQAVVGVLACHQLDKKPILRRDRHLVALTWSLVCVLPGREMGFAHGAHCHEGCTVQVDRRSQAVGKCFPIHGCFLIGQARPAERCAAPWQTGVCRSWEFLGYSVSDALVPALGSSGARRLPLVDLTTILR